jgi:hypothetical protein
MSNNSGTDPDKYNVDHYTVGELLQLLELPTNVDVVTAEDVTLITASNITKYDAKALTKQLVAPREAAEYKQLSLFFKDVKQKLLAAVREARMMNTDADKAAAAARAAVSGSGWDSAVSKANAAADASIRARARADAAEAAAAAISQSNPSASDEPDIIEQQQQQNQQSGSGSGSGTGSGTGSGSGNGGTDLLWSRYQYLPPPVSDAGRYAHTDRDNQFELSRDENDHYVMKQRRLGIPSAYNVPIAQGTMNPTLRNTYKRTVIINSKRRAVLFPHSTDPLAPSSSTNFNVQLSEELKNVVSLHMLSVTVPYTWHAVDAATGTNCFNVTLLTDEITERIVVPTGNYAPADLVAAVQGQIAKADNRLSEHLGVEYSSATGQCKFTNKGGDNLTTIRLTFFDPTRKLDCEPGCKQSNKINNSLGWILGFRSNSVHTGVEYNSFALDGMVYDISAATTTTTTNTLTGEAVVDTYGPKYFMIVLDDYKNNRINCGVVTVTSTETRLDTPYYYDNDIPCERVPDPFGGVTDYITVNIPSEPRKLTSGQLYTINEIRRNRELTTIDRVAEPTASNVFAIVHLNKNALAMGASITDSSPAIAAFTREYFGPVTLQRFKVTLVDDNGFTVNLNGNDWSFTFAAESLYEY